MFDPVKIFVMGLFPALTFGGIVLSQAALAAPLSLHPRAGDSDVSASQESVARSGSTGRRNTRLRPPKLPPALGGAVPAGFVESKPTSAMAEKSQSEPGPGPEPEPEPEPGDVSREVAVDTPKAKESGRRSSRARSRSRRSKVAKGSAKKKRRSSRGPKPAKICDYRSPLHVHVVQEGEHIGLIAGRYGIFGRDVLATNPKLKNPNVIRPGQRLDICPELPPRESIELTHVIAEGDTLGSVARAHGLSLDELIGLQLKPIKDPNRVFLGQPIRIVKDGEVLRGFGKDARRGPGRLGTSVALGSHENYVIKRPHLAYGTERTIRLIEHSLSRYRARASGGPKVHVGDISRRGGGPLKGHLSHQRGVDVDVGLVLKGANADTTRFVKATEGNLDVRRTWLLVREFLATKEVRYIFLDYAVQRQLYDYARSHGASQGELDTYFQYPRGRGRNHGIVRHWRGHRDHIHVRFRR